MLRPTKSGSRQTGIEIANAKNIEKATVQLPSEDSDKRAGWLTSRRAQEWDKQIAEHIAAERLDALLAEVSWEHEAGLSRPP